MPDSLSCNYFRMFFVIKKNIHHNIYRIESILSSRNLSAMTEDVRRMGQVSLDACVHSLPSGCHPLKHGAACTPKGHLYQAVFLKIFTHRQDAERNPAGWRLQSGGQ